MIYVLCCFSSVVETWKEKNDYLFCPRDLEYLLDLGVIESLQIKCVVYSLQ